VRYLASNENGLMLRSDYLPVVARAGHGMSRKRRVSPVVSHTVTKGMNYSMSGTSTAFSTQAQRLALRQNSLLGHRGPRCVYIYILLFQCLSVVLLA
jgi:hypothetical protein